MTKNDVWEKVGNQFSPLFRMTVKGQQVEGLFVESRECPSKKFKGKVSHFHEIEIIEGTHGVKAGKVALVGGGQLDYLIKAGKFEAGDKIRVTYEGVAEASKKWKKGMEPHQFIVERQASK